MKYSENILRLKNFAKRYGFPTVSLAFLLLAFKLLPDYGLVFDSPKNFDEGRINLNYLLTGRAALFDQFTLTYQIHGAFFFMAADLCKRILSDGLGWLDPVSARHAFLPVLVFFFMNFYDIFLKKRTGAVAAFLTCALLLTIPGFWGHAFNNIKDIPLFVFFSLAIFCFFKWRDSGFQKLRYLYGFFVAFGLALLSKLYAVLIPVILVLWLVFLKGGSLCRKNPAGPAPERAGRLLTRRNLLHGLLGAALVLALAALFFMPAFYAVEDKMIFWEMKTRTVKKLMERGSQGWSFSPWLQIFYIIPVLTLVMGALGLVRTLLRRPLGPLSALMLTWFFVVMGVACTPLFPVYNGIRLFMVFLVPFSFFAIAGVTQAAELLAKIPRVKKNWAVGILGVGLILVQIAGIGRTHPYETTFFNRLAGGLKGAQEKQIPDAADYWLTSYREAVRWVNRNAPPHASLWLPSIDDFYMVRHYPLRSDLKFDFVRNIPLPGNSFLLITPGGTCWVNTEKNIREGIKAEAGRMEKVHTIKRQGGEILTVYYKA